MQMNYAMAYWGIAYAAGPTQYALGTYDAASKSALPKMARRDRTRAQRSTTPLEQALIAALKARPQAHIDANMAEWDRNLQR